MTPDPFYITVPADDRGLLRVPRSVSPRLAVVVPCHNEEEALPATHASLIAHMRRMRASGLIASGSFILYVDDGSRDASWSLIEALCSDFDGEVEGLCLSANKGHQNALMAGVMSVADRCDAVVTIDADLQDDPGAIEAMVGEYMKGNEIVYGVRGERRSDSFAKRGAAQAYYRLIGLLGVRTVYNHSDFRLMGSDAIRALAGYGERNLYLRGIVPLLGYAQSKVYFSRAPRVAGHTKYPFGRMLNFAIDGITSFSVRPVRMVFMAGLVFLLVALCILAFVLVRYFTRQTIEGWASLMLSVWFCTGVLLMALGVIGEYVGKIYTEVKQRPRYHVERHAGRAASASSEPQPKSQPRQPDHTPSPPGSATPL